MRSKAIFLVSAFVVAGLLGGVTASSVAAARSTTVTWNVSSLTAGQVKSLSAIATTNSTGVKTWSKTGSCTLTPKSKPTKLTMGTGQSCTLTLKIAKSGNYSAKTSSKTIILALYGVGDTGPAGGTIFYVDLTRSAGSQYFEAACAGWYDGTCGGNDLNDPTLAWGNSPLAISGADGTAIGDGEQNTTDIVTCCAETWRAGTDAYDLVLGGQTDWFLPSKDELNQMYVQINAIGRFLSRLYWSSSEVDGGYFAWMQAFYNGSQGIWLRGVQIYVRPVRSF